MFVHVCVCVCVNVCMCVYIYTCVCEGVHSCVCLLVGVFTRWYLDISAGCTHQFVRGDVHGFVHIFVRGSQNALCIGGKAGAIGVMRSASLVRPEECMCVCMYACMLVCVCVCTCSCLQTHMYELLIILVLLGR